jgi:hypothetical protein
VAGAAWAIDIGGVRVTGVDRHPWAVEEANRTYRDLGVNGRAVKGDAARTKLPSGARAGIIAAYTINELPDATRGALLPRFLETHSRGTRVLIIEPIARRMAAWWDGWQREFEAAGGQAAEWRFRDVPLPPAQRRLGRAAGLDPRELTARSLWLGGSR